MGSLEGPIQSPGSSETMGTPGVDGGGVFSATLTNQLVETVAEVVDRAGAQGAALLVQLAVVRVVLALALVVASVPACSQ